MDELEKKAQELLEKGFAKNLQEAKSLAEKLIAEKALDIQKALDEKIKTVEEKAAADVKLVKDELDKKSKEIEDWQTEVNRFRTHAEEEKNKGRKFDVALDEAFEENIDRIKGFANGDTKKVRMQLKAVGDMGLSNVSGLRAANTQVAPGIIGLPNTALHMRDIMNTGRMTTSSFTYLKETGGEGDVATWGENSGKKAKLDLDYLEAIAPSQFIAGFIKISRKSLDDLPALRSSLASRLLQKYLNAEDRQILTGNGTGNNLAGILPAATAYNGSEDTPLDRILDAAGQLEEGLNDEGGYFANGIILKPRDYMSILRNKGNTEEYTLPGLGVVTMQNGVLYLGGIPVYKINAMPAATRQFLVGDWLMGAQLLLREDPIVEFFAEDEDNVQTNQITVRVEGRVALPIYRNEAFVKGALAGTPQV